MRPRSTATRSRRRHRSALNAPVPSPTPPRVIQPTLPLVRRERDALCDTALSVGPEAPTLCGGWDARDLVAHLLVRERGWWGPAAGIAIPPLAGVTERAMEHTARRPFPEMVERLRERPLTPYRLPGVERLTNTLEYFVHHEDLRRAQPGWEPRDLPPGDEDELWKLLPGSARLSTRNGSSARLSKRNLTLWIAGSSTW